MSNLQQLAALIPAEYRKEILELNMIQQAIGVTYNPTMKYLFTIWKNYIEPDASLDCNLCAGRILKNLQAMLPVLIDLEKKANTLNAV